MYASAAVRSTGLGKASAMALASTSRASTSSLSRSPLALQQQRRAYAQLVNDRNSVDHLFGSASPSPPEPGTDAAADGAANAKKARKAKEKPVTIMDVLSGAAGQTLLRPNNPNDLSDLLQGKDRKRDGRDGASAKQRGRSAATAAIGAMRRGKGTAIPTQDFDDDFLSSEKSAAAQAEAEAKGAVDVKVNVPDTGEGWKAESREEPHRVDVLGGNELDERVVAAARALHHARTHGRTPGKDASSIPSLLNAFSANSDRTLSTELPNESRPAESRQVPLTSALSDEADLQQKTEDGVLLIAYITGLDGKRSQERISVCSGFAVEGGDRLSEADSKGRGALIVTCAHTLRGAIGSANKGDAEQQNSQHEESSIALAITRSGQVLPVTGLLSSLPESDLVLLQVGEEAIVADEEADIGAPLRSSTVKLRTLPVNPYPATVGTELCVSSFWGWEDDAGSTLPAFHFQTSADATMGAMSTGAASESSSSSSSPASSGGLESHTSGLESAATSVSSTMMSPAVALTIAPAPATLPSSRREKETVKRERDDAARSRWGRARLVEYRDDGGGEARTGTYDDLAQMDFKLLVDDVHNPPALQRSTMRHGNWPPPGSSGGPIVDATTGAVVGVIRGTKMGVLEGRRGYGTPAERIYFMFALPGFGDKKKG